MSDSTNFKTRLLIAVFPVAIVLILLALEIFMRQHILFTSLVSSIFLIYLRPDDLMNSSVNIAVSHIIAALVGYGAFLLLGETYWAASSAVIVVVIVLTLLSRLHPPSVATSLTFVYRQHSESDLMLFALLLGVVVLLFLVKKVYRILESKYAALKKSD